MLIYNYSPANGEYLSTGEAREDPMESGRYLTPANATAKPTPTLKPGETAMFDGDNWRVVPDYRGRSVCGLDLDGYYTGLTELALGETPDARRILADPPPADLPRPRWSGSAWIDGRTSAEMLRDYTAAVQARLDDFARTRSYDGILSACSYATSTNAKFASEGQYCVTARDNTWAKCYAIMDDVTAGKRPMPTLDDLLLELPALTWDANV